MGSVFLRGNSWVIEFVVNGKVKRESIGKKGIITKTMAREVLAKRELQVKLGQYDMIKAEIPTFNEFAKEYLQYIDEVNHKKSAERDRHAIRLFSEMYGDSKLSEISANEIDDYKRVRGRDVKPATINRELQSLSPLFNLAKKRKKFFQENPVSEAGKFNVNTEKQRILTLEEERRLLDSSPPHLRNILSCALNTGMRIGEIISLRWEHINLEADRIIVHHTNTKNKRTREIPINTNLRKLFLELKLQSGGSEYVFLNSLGTPYKSYNSLNQVFRRARKLAGVEDFRFHDTRHTAATRMSENTGNILAVNKILGHSSIQMTMRYAHPENSLVEAIESLTASIPQTSTDQDQKT